MAKKYWVKHPAKLIVLFPVKMLNSILGVKVDVKKISKKEKLRRKKYMGVWRWESSNVRTMMVRLPKILNKYVKKRKRKMTVWSSGISVSPNRMNSVKVWFFIAEFLCLWSCERETYIMRMGEWHSRILGRGCRFPFKSPFFMVKSSVQSDPNRMSVGLSLILHKICL